MRRTRFVLLAFAAVLLACLLIGWCGERASAAAVIEAHGRLAGLAMGAERASRSKQARRCGGSSTTRSSAQLPVLEQRQLDAEHDDSVAPDDPPIDATRSTNPGTYTFLCTIHAAHDRHGHRRGGGGPARERARVLQDRRLPARLDPEGIPAIQQLGDRQRLQRVDGATRGPLAAAFTDANLAQYDVVAFLSTTGDILTDAAAGRVRALHPVRRRLRRHPRRVRHRVHVALVRRARRRLLPQPPGRNARPRRRHQGRRRALDDRPPGLLDAHRRVVQLPGHQPPGGERQRAVADYSPRASQVHVLATVDESTYDEEDGNTVDDDHPVAWCSNFDGGRSWYTAMGHTQASFADANFRSHLLGGLRTAAGADGRLRRAARDPPTAARLREGHARRRHEARRWRSTSRRTAARSTSSGRRPRADVEPDDGHHGHDRGHASPCRRRSTRTA